MATGSSRSIGDVRFQPRVLAAFVAVIVIGTILLLLVTSPWRSNPKAPERVEQRQVDCSQPDPRVTGAANALMCSQQMLAVAKAACSGVGVTEVDLTVYTIGVPAPPTRWRCAQLPNG